MIKKLTAEKDFKKSSYSALAFCRRGIKTSRCLAQGDPRILSTGVCNSFVVECGMLGIAKLALNKGA